MEGTEFQLLLVGFRNELARGRVINLLRERAGRDGAEVPADLQLPHVLLSHADSSTANRLSAELVEQGALVRVCSIEKAATGMRSGSAAEAVAPTPAERPPAERRSWLAMRFRGSSLVWVMVVLGVIKLAGSLTTRVAIPPRTGPMNRDTVEARPRSMVEAAGLSRNQRAEIDRLVTQKDFAAAIARLSEFAKEAGGHWDVGADLDNIGKQGVAGESKEGRLDGALKIVEQSLAVQETPVLRALEGSVYLQRGDQEAARRAYERALHLGSKDSDVCLALADIHRQLGEQAAAVAMLDRAREYGATGAEFKEMARLIGREQEAESGFASSRSAHFTVSFAQGENRAAARLVLAELEGAYQTVGQRLGSYPDHVTPVVLYDAEDFQRVTQSPHWAGALYDGRIKVPVGGLGSNDTRLAGILRHEYSHVLTHLVAGENCPVWLNEGVAMWVQDEREEQATDVASAVIGLNGSFKLADLEGSLQRLSPTEAAVAYSQSYLAVRYIVKRYGELALRQLLAAFAHTANVQDAFRETLDLELTTLEEELRVERREVR